MITPTRRTPSFFSARAANGQITAPPSSVMNARRIIWDIGLPPALASSVSLPQRQNAEEGVGSVALRTSGVYNRCLVHLEDSADYACSNRGARWMLQDLLEAVHLPKRARSF